MNKAWRDLLISQHRIPITEVFTNSQEADEVAQGIAANDPDNCYLVVPDRENNYKEWVVCRVHPWNI